MSKSKFTEEQDKFIAENYSNMNTDEMSKIINKTNRQIINRAKYIGVYKTDKNYLTIDGKLTKIIDLSGQKFGRLTVVKFDLERYKDDVIKKNNKEINQVATYWICNCDCGTKILV